MKKSTLLALSFALFAGAQAFAQGETKEVTYVEDASQGYLFNRFRDNWFITAEGGANITFSPHASDRYLADRFGPSASLFVGKWFSPIIALRAGANFYTMKGMTDNGYLARLDEIKINGRQKTKINQVGPVFDAIVNLTNWWCGYKPNRFYNFSIYAGGGVYFNYSKTYDKAANGSYVSNGWHSVGDIVVGVRAGIINDFRVSKHFNINLDINYTAVDAHKTIDGVNATDHVLQAQLGLTYKFGKTEWNAPVVPVCPEAENCDELRASLAAAEGRISDLEAQLRDALNRPAAVQQECEQAPLATVYYPINSSKVNATDKNVLRAVANVMKQDTSKKYVITGWADNYTGSEQVNARLRQSRAQGVKNILVKNGVDANRLEVAVDNGSLSDLGEKCVALDRAVTIEEAK